MKDTNEKKEPCYYCTQSTSNILHKRGHFNINPHGKCIEATIRDGDGLVVIPVKYCSECGRKL